jgi:antitoxin ParD1/3/4
MDVVLPPDLEHQVAETVASGRYRSADEVVHAGLRLLFQAEQTRAARLATFQAEIQAGLDQLDRGEAISAEQLWAEVNRRLDARR